MEKCAKPVFDLSCEFSSPQYFKSSFARSMAVDCMNQSKSLDNAFLDRPVASENFINRSSKSESVWTTPVKSNRNFKGLTGISDVCNGSKIIQKESDYARVVPLRKTNRERSHSIDAAKLWKTKQDSSSSLLQQNDKNSSGHQQIPPKHSYTESDVLRLRKECQSLLEENRRLQSDLDLRTPSILNGRNVQMIDSTILQSQVDTLQWQLKQTESSRQMYRAVMEQVVRFLERAYKNLDLIKNKMDPKGHRNKLSPSRVPRSRSVHTVDVSPSRSSPQPEASLQVPRAKSIAQIEASPNYSTFRDFTWRRPRQTQSDPDEVPPEKLSQEAFRLLRTAQSLLNTREPDLAQRLCPGLDSETVPDNSSSSHRSSLASSLPGHEEEPLPCNNSQKREPMSLTTTSCNSLLRQSLDTTSLRSLNYNNNNSSLTSGLESAFAGGCRTTSPIYNSSTNCPPKSKTPSPPVPETSYPIQSSPPVSSTEDESGFSSMNSFQEVGLPLVSPSPTPSYSISSSHSKQTHSYAETHFPGHNTSAIESSTVQSNSYSTSGFQEVGLPIVEHPPNINSRGNMTPNHRRWSSSPAEALTQYSKHNASFCGAGETLRVLWV